MAQLCASSPKQQKAVDTFHKVQILVLGGAVFGGKSYLASMLSAIYADDPNSRIGVFRNTLEMMKQGGGIIDTLQSVYRNIEDVCKLEVAGNPPVGRIVSGPGKGRGKGDGCRFNFLQMQHEKDMEKIRGGAYSLAIIEEAIPFFSQEQIEMIMSRLRSESRHESKMIITCNPSPDHYICELIKDYYLDEDGYARDDRCGDVRYFYKFNDQYYWGNSREEVYKLVDAEGGYDNSKISYEKRLERILSFSFVQLTAEDNPIGVANNPSYMAYLEGLDPVKKARNLFGNWFIRPEGAGVFERKWLQPKRLVDVPDNCIAMRGIDKAHAIPSETNPNPDFTAISPLMLKDADGFYYLLGNYLEECSDEPKKKSDKKVLGRFRRLAGARDLLIAKQLVHDKSASDLYKYLEPSLVVPKDSGAGTGDYNATIALMLEKGIKTVKDQTVSNVAGKKLLDFSQFTAACQNGLVFVVEETFDKDSYNYIMGELEKFDGVTKSTQTRKDDFVDSFSICFNALVASGRPYRTILRNQRKSDTLQVSIKKD